MLQIMHVSRCLFGVMALQAALSATHVFAQPKSGDVQPDILDFGHLCVGSTVEGSLRVFVKGETAEGVSVDIQTPPFVNIVDRTLRTQAFGEGNTFVVCDVDLSVDTSVAGIKSDEMRLTIADKNVRVPIRASVMNAPKDSPRVLIVETPFDKFSTGDGTTFLPWLYVVDELGLNVDYWDVVDERAVLRDVDVGHFDVILLATEGLTSLGEQDIAKLKQYVKNGGRLIVVANCFFRGTVPAANKALVWGGLKMSDEEPPLMAGAETIILSETHIKSHPLTTDVDEIRVRRPSPISVTDPTKGTILVEAPEFPGQGYAAIGRFGEGEVIVLGQSLWWHWITEDKAGTSDNRVLLRNLMDRRK